jgi:preprotein translocase subunit SecE
MGSKAASPFKKLRLSQRGPVKVLARIFRPIGRALRWLTPNYLVNSWREVRQVIWPSRRETWRLTLAVFVFAIVFGALVAGVDKGLDEIFKKVVLK